MKVNSHILRLAGKAELPEEIEIGSNYHVSLEGAITSKTDSDNQDGTINRTYKFEPVKVELLNQLGKSLKLKDARSLSKQLRACFWKDWKDENNPLSFEDYYDRLMLELIKEHKQISEMFSPE